MKKMILAAFVAVASLTASAQWWVGGEVGFNSYRATVDGHKVGSASNFVVAPEVGYKLNDKLDVAVLIGYAHAEDGNKIFNYELAEAFDYANGFKLNPYLRYNFAEAGNFKFFVDGGVSYALLHVCGVDKSANVWELGLKPGISYSLSDKVSLVAHVGSFGWQFIKQGDYKRNAWEAGVDGNNISLGCYVNF
ncbi:MAG: porin family protein [Bacteroidaceae bacterium]|nr:porin family protein [Bacteroidaceae bacterium]MBP5731863.1 porin family protein [Bacteroidaceae bacterium]